MHCSPWYSWSTVWSWWHARDGTRRAWGWCGICTRGRSRWRRLSASPWERKQLQVYWKCSYKHYKGKSQTCNLWCTTVVARIKWDQDTSCQILPINHFAPLLSRSNKKHNNNNKKGAYTHIKKTDFFPPLWEISVRSNSPGTNLGGERIRAGSGTWRCLVEKCIFCNVPKLVR